jgi:cell division protein FtsB
MSSPKQREFHNEEQFYAPAPAPRKRSFLRRHWLTGAFVMTMVMVAGFAGKTFLDTEAKLHDARQERAVYEDKLEEAKRKNQALSQDLKQLSSDEYMEMMAKKLGYVNANETVYQGTGSDANAGTNKGR